MNLKYEIELDASLLPTILGSEDQHLRVIEKSARSELTVRGTTLFVHGPQEEQVSIESLFRDLLAMAKTGDMTGAGLRSAIRLAGLTNPLDSEASAGELIMELKSGTLRTKTRNQVAYLRAAEENELVFAVGPAGTGKTYLAVAFAVKAFLTGDVDRIILVRPAVEAGENLGFLPGALQEKVEPYFRPIYDALMEMIPPEKIQRFIAQKRIEIAPLAYMRGRTLANAFVILDEAQNTTSDQLKMFLTRLGRGSKAIVTGDLTQIDLPEKERSGLSESLNILQNIRGIGFVTLDHRDVVRHTLVMEIIKAYEKNGPGGTK